MATGPRRRSKSAFLQGYLAQKKRPPPKDPRRALGIVLLQGPRGRRFLMGEVPLYTCGNMVAMLVLICNKRICFLCVQ